MATLGERIKELRTSHNLTQEEFGKLFGIVKSTVSLYESNKSTPDDTIKLKICEYFNVSMDYLMGTTLGTELNSMILELSEEFDEPYEKLVDIFLNRRIPYAMTKDNLRHFFAFYLNKRPKGIESDLSPELQEIIDICSSLSPTSLDKILDYARFISKNE